MDIERITTYKGRFCAYLKDGRAMLANGTMHLMLCEPVDSGMKVIEPDIVAGIMMRTEDDFRVCVENYQES